VGIRIRYQGSGAEGDQQLDRAILEERAGPDVFHPFAEQVIRFNDTEQLSPPAFSAATVKDFNQSAYTAAIQKGKPVAYPFWIQPRFHVLALDTFRQAGVAFPSAEWTFAEFLDSARRLTVQRPDGEQVYGFAQTANDYALLLIDGARPYSIDLIAWRFQGHFARSALEKWTALASAGIMPPNWQVFDNRMLAASFLSGAVGVVQCSVPLLEDLLASPDWPYGQRWGVATLLGDSERVTWGDLEYVGVRRQDDADREAAAHLFARYLTGLDVGMDLHVMNIDFWPGPPARTSALSVYAGSHPARAKVAQMAAYTYVPPNFRTWQRIEQTLLRPARDAVLAGTKTAEQALNDIAYQAQALVNEGRP
jgi:multiple sugar transport system substrate-binding protein